MKITNYEISKNKDGENVITLTFNNKYPFEINCKTGETLFDNKFKGELDFEIKEKELKQIEKDPNAFFLNNRYLELLDWGGKGLNISSSKLNTRDYYSLSLEYNCYLGRCWEGDQYSYILFLQMDLH